MCLQAHWESALTSAHPKLTGTRAVLIKPSMSGAMKTTPHTESCTIFDGSKTLFFFLNRKSVIIVGKLLYHPPPYFCYWNVANLIFKVEIEKPQ